MDKLIPTAKWIEEIRQAIMVLDALDMDDKHRKTVFRCLQSELFEAQDRYDMQEQTARNGKRWTDEDIEVLRETLAGRVAKSWQQERLNVLEASLKVHRSEKSTKRKAIELGFARAVDYWLNNHDQY